MKGFKISWLLYQNNHDDKNHVDHEDKFAKICKKIQKDGGKFKYNNGINENGDIQVYVGVQFIKMICDRRKGFVCTIRFATKYNKAKNEKERREFWERSKKLLTGSFVCLLLHKSSNKELFSLYFGVVI